MTSKVPMFMLLVSFAAAQNGAKPKIKPDLSDDFAKAAIKYVVAVQNFELNATTDSTEKAEGRIESAKEDMEAAESTFGCDEKTAELGNGQLCPEHMASFWLELHGLTHVQHVKIFYLDAGSGGRAEINKSASCLDAWKRNLQRRDSRQPDECGTKGSNTAVQ